MQIWLFFPLFSERLVLFIFMIICSNLLMKNIVVLQYFANWPAVFGNVKPLRSARVFTRWRRHGFYTCNKAGCGCLAFDKKKKRWEWNFIMLFFSRCKYIAQFFSIFVFFSYDFWPVFLFAFYRLYRDVFIRLPNSFERILFFAIFNIWFLRTGKKTSEKFPFVFPVSKSMKRSLCFEKRNETLVFFLFLSSKAFTLKFVILPTVIFVF